MARLTVSVVIPVFNGEAWIAKALASVRRQTYPANEILVVDDASIDRSADVAARAGAKVFRLARNSGDAVARNVGLLNASCDCIAMLDADDLWNPRHLEILVSLLDRYPEAAIACAATQRIGLKSGVVPGYVPPGPPGHVFWQAFDDWLHTTIGALFRRQALLAIGGFSEDRRYSCDYDLWLRLSCDYLFVSTREITSYWRWHGQQQSLNFPAQLRAVYYYRHRFWQACRQGCRPMDPRRIAERCLSLWLADCEVYGHGDFGAMHACLIRSSLYLRPANERQFLLVLKAVFRLLAGMGSLPRSLRKGGRFES